MARLTYSQARSTAIAKAKENNCGNVILIYKDAGGNFRYKLLKEGETVCYTAIKSIVWHDKTTGLVKTEVSRETIANFLEAMNINMVYVKFT